MTEITSSSKTMHVDTDSVSTESPSYFTDLGEKAELTGRPVPGSRHLDPGEKTTKQGRKEGAVPECVVRLSLLCVYKTV